MTEPKKRPKLAQLETSKTHKKMHCTLKNYSKGNAVHSTVVLVGCVAFFFIILVVRCFNFFSASTIMAFVCFAYLPSTLNAHDMEKSHWISSLFACYGSLFFYFSPAILCKTEWITALGNCFRWMNVDSTHFMRNTFSTDFFFFGFCFLLLLLDLCVFIENCSSMLSKSLFFTQSFQRTVNTCNETKTQERNKQETSDRKEKRKKHTISKIQQGFFSVCSGNGASFAFFFWSTNETTSLNTMWMCINSYFFWHWSLLGFVCYCLVFGVVFFLCIAFARDFVVFLYVFSSSSALCVPLLIGSMCWYSFTLKRKCT